VQKANIRRKTLNLTIDVSHFDEYNARSSTF